VVSVYEINSWEKVWEMERFFCCAKVVYYSGKTDDLINLLDVQIRHDDTYKNLKSFDKDDAKTFSEFS